MAYDSRMDVYAVIFAGDRLVATIGLKDMVVVDTPDATLVIPKERVHEVRKIVGTFKPMPNKATVCPIAS
jgi:hypothetical protein